MLNDDVLLSIFRHFLDGSSRLWPTLTHVCRSWRQIILGSPLGLHLRLYCTYGMPVRKSLYCWPPFPLVVSYGGSPMLGSPAPEDEENIKAALEQSERVHSITLTVTKSLLENLSTISEPCSRLEELDLLSRDNLQLTLPRAFLWNQCLRTLKLTRIAIPTLPQLLSLSNGLVDLRLHEIPQVGYFSPGVFANALSGMTQLETLSFHHLTSPPHRNLVNLPLLPVKHVFLPSLANLKYRGTSKYLDSFVARIDAPLLRDIDITFFFQPTMDASQLGQFIERVEMQPSLSQGDILTSTDAISISISEPGVRRRLALQISCKELDWQLSSMLQICNHFSPFLSRVTNLGITTQTTSGSDDMDHEKWAELIHSFRGAVAFRTAGKYVADILSSLSLDVGESNVLPSLGMLHVPELCSDNGALRGSVESLTSSRRLSGHPVDVYDGKRFICGVCHSSYTQRQGLSRHKKDKHSQRNHVCPLCKSYVWSPARKSLFLRHLKKHHPGAALTDTHISDPALQNFTSSYSGTHGAEHDNLLVPDLPLYPDPEAKLPMLAFSTLEYPSSSLDDMAVPSPTSPHRALSHWGTK